MELLKKQDLIPDGVLCASKKQIGDRFDLHQHDFFELEYILSGTGDYIIDGVRYEMRPGALFFLTPANVHSVYSPQAELINLMFTGEMKDSEALYRLTVQRAAPAFFLQGETQELVRLLASEIVAAGEHGRHAYALSCLNCLLLKLSDMSDGEPDRSVPHIKKAIVYLLEHFSSDISLENVAAHVGISKNYLSELFHHEVSVGYKTYLDDLRFHYVAKLLSFSDLSVTQIYEEGGFSDYANFSRRFKERYGMSPSEYRKQRRS